MEEEFDEKIHRAGLFDRAKRKMEKKNQTVVEGEVVYNNQNFENVLSDKTRRKLSSKRNDSVVKMDDESTDDISKRRMTKKQVDIELQQMDKLFKNE
jgi:hypothetical protein